MEREKRGSASLEQQHIFTAEEVEQIETYLELLGDKGEIIGLLDINSYFFANWSVMINDSVLDMITKRQKLGVSYENEQGMLTNINYFFNRMAYFSTLLSDWSKELEYEKSLTESKIEQANSQITYK